MLIHEGQIRAYTESRDAIEVKAVKPEKHRLAFPQMNLSVVAASYAALIAAVRPEACGAAITLSPSRSVRSAVAGAALVARARVQGRWEARLRHR